MSVGGPACQGADELARVNGNQGVRDARCALRRSRRHRARTDSANPPARGPERLARGMKQGRNRIKTPMQGPAVLLDGRDCQRLPGSHAARSPDVAEPGLGACCKAMLRTEASLPALDVAEPGLGACCKSVNSSVEGLLWMSIRPQHKLLRPLKAGIPPFGEVSTTDTVGLASRQTISTGLQRLGMFGKGTLSTISAQAWRMKSERLVGGEIGSG